MTTQGQDNRFGKEFLEDIVEWIGENMTPDEVFSEADLESWALEWAKARGYTISEE